MSLRACSIGKKMIQGQTTIFHPGCPTNYGKGGHVMLPTCSLRKPLHFPVTGPLLLGSQYYCFLFDVMTFVCTKQNVLKSGVFCQWFFKNI